MGLLDSLTSGSQGGYGGLLDMLMYQSPLNKPQDVPQPEYDAMGNYTGITPQAAQDPFGGNPNMAQWAQQFAPKSPFTSMAPQPPVQQFAGVPIQQAPQSAPQPQDNQPNRLVNVGGYQMPQFGAQAPGADPQLMPTDVSAASRQTGQPASQNLPPAFGQDSGSNFAAGLRNFGSPGGIINKVADAVEGFSTGRRTDPASVKQQNLKAQYDSLVPMLGPQKAMLAVMNPEAGKILLAQALEKKQYGFTKLDNDTVLRTDPMTGKADVAYGGQKSDTMTGPDGKTITMPEGADPKTWRNEITKINADVAAGKKTEVQAKSEKFGNKMENAEKNLAGLQGQGASLFGQIAGGIPLGNYVQSKEYQNYTQAKNNFITALLRDESGAAIGSQEFTRYEKELFPQPGDSASVMSQKADARKIAIDAMKKSAGPGYKSPAADQPRIRKYNPTTGVIE